MYLLLYHFYVIKYNILTVVCMLSGSNVAYTVYMHSKCKLRVLPYTINLA